jgi:DDE_Tnp_1-associated
LAQIITRAVLLHKTRGRNSVSAHDLILKLMNILFLVSAAVISGAEGWEAIETFGEEKLDWRRKYFPFVNRGALA